MGWKLKLKENNAYVWACDFYTDLHIHIIQNFAQYAQPFDPYEPGFDKDFSDKFTDFSKIIIEMPQSQVMYNGYGRKVDLDDFPVTSDFLSGKIKVPDGEYTFQKLLDMKLTYPYAARFSTNLYNKNLIFGIDSGELSRADAAYVHGSVGLHLVESSIRLSAKGSARIAEAEIKADDDNWDHTSDNKFVDKKVNPFLERYFGPIYNNLRADPEVWGASTGVENSIKIKFIGPGRKERMEKRTMSGWNAELKK